MSRLHTLPRLFVAPDQMEAAANSACPDMVCVMTPEQARYLGTVMRRAEGDKVRLFNDRDGEWLASITGLRRDRGTFALEERLRDATPESGPVLAFALLKRDATDMVIRTGTELGVTRFVPVLTERTIAHRVNGERLEAIAIEAAEQCERLTVPAVSEPVRFADFLGGWDVSRKLFIAAERMEGKPAEPAFAGAAPGDGIVVGPEGGFSPAELETALARSFVKPVTLGERVLRAPTAVAAALTLFDARIRNA